MKLIRQKQEFESLLQANNNMLYEYRPNESTRAGRTNNVLVEYASIHQQYILISYFNISWDYAMNGKDFD